MRIFIALPMFFSSSSEMGSPDHHSSTKKKFSKARSPLPPTPLSSSSRRDSNYRHRKTSMSGGLTPLYLTGSYRRKTEPAAASGSGLKMYRDCRLVTRNQKRISPMVAENSPHLPKGILQKRESFTLSPMASPKLRSVFFGSPRAPAGKDILMNTF